MVGTFGGGSSLGLGATAYFGTRSITSATGTAAAIFVAKFSPSKGWLWAEAIDPDPPPVSAYQGNGIVIDGLGRVDIVGSLGDGGSGGIVVAQLSSRTGATYWTHVFTGEGVGTGITAEPSHDSRSRASLLDVTGTIYGYGTTPLAFAGPVSSPGTSDLFVGQLTEAGVPVWGRAFPASPATFASGSSITVDNATRHLFAVGTLANTTPVVVEYTSVGRFVSSATPLRDPVGGDGTGITVDGKGHLYVTGTSSTGAVVAKLSETTLGRSGPTTSVRADPATTTALGVAVDKWGHPFITGAFSGTINFGSGPLTSAAREELKSSWRSSFLPPVWPSGPSREEDQGPASPWASPSTCRTTGRVSIVGDYIPPATFGTITLGVDYAANIFVASLK